MSKTAIGAIEIPKKIETRQPVSLPPEGQLKKQLTAMLDELTVDQLHDMLHGLFKVEKNKKYKYKAVLVEEAAAALCFTNIEPFNAWFHSLPPLTQGIVWYTAFEKYMPAKHVETWFGVSVVQQNKVYEWQREWVFKKEANLDFLRVFQTHEQPIIAMPWYLQIMLKPWFVPPPAASLEYCAIAEGMPQDDPMYDNSNAVAESFPLFCDQLKAVMAGMKGTEKEKAVRGLKKRAVAEMQRASDFLPFPMGGDDAPNSVELTARFLLLMNSNRISRPENAYVEIKNLVVHFFSKDTRYPKQWYSPDRNFLECSLCIDHLTKTAGYYLEEDKRLPPSRIIFKELLHAIAEDGRSFDADRLAGYVKYHWDSFIFCNADYERTFKLKADTLELDGVTYKNDYYVEFNPIHNFRHDFIVKPVLKAYLYLFASLGLLAITQKQPPLVRTLKDKKLPLSPYDSLGAVRVTDFGRWCLGLSEKQPSLPEQQYEAIADRELFLVTVRGKSLERKVYLDRIGQKLGEDRWRISAGSFVAGCSSKKEIEERVASFKRLIDPEPAPHWEALFQKLRSRAGLFDEKKSDVQVYALPADKTLREELLSDPVLKTIALRCEGNLLVVPAKKVKQFFAFLADHGIASFS
jgi:hypothetical protein